MRWLSFALIFSALITFVAGQLWLKRAMEKLKTDHFASGPFLIPFVIGIASMTVSFFITLGLLQHFDLSYLFPFQGFSVIIVSGAAAVLLREKLTWRLALGAILISAGIVLVSLS